MFLVEVKVWNLSYCLKLKVRDGLLMVVGRVYEGEVVVFFVGWEFRSSY